MASSNLDLNGIIFRSRVRSAPLRDNFTDIENEFNALRAEVYASIASTASEVTSARDNFGNLSDNVHARKCYTGALNTGGIISAVGTPDARVRVTAGNGVVNGVGVDWNSGTSGTIAAVTNTSRKNIAVINTDNTVTVVVGDTVSTSTILPTIASTQRPLAIIDQSTASPAVIGAADITDIRGQGCRVANTGKWFFKIQDAVDYVSSTLGGLIEVAPGNYYESVDISGKNNLTLKGSRSKVYRPSKDLEALQSVNTVSNETTGNKITGFDFKGGGWAGATRLAEINYTDEFMLTDCSFDGNTVSTIGTTINFAVRNSDKFLFSDNSVFNVNGTLDFSTGTFSTCSNYQADGYKLEVKNLSAEYIASDINTTGTLASDIIVSKDGLNPPELTHGVAWASGSLLDVSRLYGFATSGLNYISYPAGFTRENTVLMVKFEDPGAAGNYVAYYAGGSFTFTVTLRSSDIKINNGHSGTLYYYFIFVKHT